MKPAAMTMLLGAINLCHLKCSCLPAPVSRIAVSTKTFQPHSSPLISTWPCAGLENVNQLCGSPAPNPPMASYHSWSKNLTFSPGCAQSGMRWLCPLLAPVAALTLASWLFQKTHCLLGLWHLNFSPWSSSSPLLRGHCRRGPLTCFPVLSTHLLHSVFLGVFFIVFFLFPIAAIVT